MADFITFMCPGDGPDIKICKLKLTSGLRVTRQKGGGGGGGGELTMANSLAIYVKKHFFETSTTVSGNSSVEKVTKTPMFTG